MHAAPATSPRPTSWEWALTALIGANLTWTTLALGGYPAATRPVTGLFAGLLLVVHGLQLAWEARTPRAPHPAAWLPLPFLVAAAANAALVSPVPWLGWIEVWIWLQGAAVFVVVVNGVRSPAPRTVLLAVLVGLALVAVFLGGYQRFVAPAWLIGGHEQVPQFIGRASGPFGIPNSLGAFLILLLPVTLALGFRGPATARVWWSWVAAVLAAGLVLTLSRGAWLSLALAVLVWPVLAGGGSRRRLYRRLAAVLAGLVGFGVALYFVVPGAQARLDRLVADQGELSRPILWQAAVNLWRERPLVGTGAGSYNVLFERHRPAGFIDEPQWAHSEYLNLLSDLGLLGLGAFAVGLGGLGWFCLRRERGAASGGPASVLAPRSVRLALGIGGLAFAVHLGVEFHLRLPALTLAAAVVAGLALPPGGAPRGETGPAGGRRRRGGVALAVSAAILTAIVWRGQSADGLAQTGLERLARANRGAAGPTVAVAPAVAQASAELTDATRLWPGHAGAWAGLSAARAFEAFLFPERSAALGPPAETAARAALARSAVVPDFWLRLGVALDLQGRRAEARQAFERALERAPRTSAAWYYYADHLSRDTNGRAAALRAIGTCLSLDPGNAAAEALRAKLEPVP